MEKDIKMLEELFDDDSNSKSNEIWFLSVLILFLMNKPDNERPIINIILGDD